MESPLSLVFRNLVGGGMLRLGEGLYLELVGQLQGGVVERDVVFENLGHRRLFEDRLPGALGLARAAVDTLVRLNIQHVGEALFVLAHILVTAVDRTHADTSGVNAVYAQSWYGPWQVSSSSPIRPRGLLDY